MKLDSVQSLVIAPVLFQGIPSQLVLLLFVLALSPTLPKQSGAVSTTVIAVSDNGVLQEDDEAGLEVIHKSKKPKMADQGGDHTEWVDVHFIEPNGN